MADNTNSLVDTNKTADIIKASQGKIVLGIDGIRDEVWQVVETRLNKNECITFEKVRSYAEYILSRGEGGMATELLRKRVGYGGFTGNTGCALGAMGYSPLLLGMYGSNGIDSAFKELDGSCSLVSVGSPAVCHVLEFTDGKIMLPYLSELLSFNWETLESVLGMDRIHEVLKDTDIFAFGYWSNLHAFDELITNIHKILTSNNHAVRMFHDFANIKKRSEAALKTSLKLMAGLNRELPMTLSLNEHEAALLFGHYERKFSDDIKTLPGNLALLREEIGIDEIIIHTPHFAVGASANGETAVHNQVYCEKPVRTAGAGDTFNAGYIAASLGNTSLCERLAVGNAATLFFVTHGYPPDRDKLCESIK